MLEESGKKKILDRNYYLNKRKDARKKTKFLASKHRLFLFGIVFGFALIVAIYLATPFSRIFKISVEGNVYLSDETIRGMADLTEGDSYILMNPLTIEKKLKKNALIAECDVKRLDNRVVCIDVEETKIIGYAYEESEPVLILCNGDRIPLTLDNLSLIENVPLIEGYTREQMDLIRDGFGDIDHNLIDEISEIHRYPFSYDENMMELVMRDGNFIFVSHQGLSLIKDYYYIVSSYDTSKEKVCLYLDEVTNTGYVSKCPWERNTVISDAETPDDSND